MAMDTVWAGRPNVFVHGSDRARCAPPDAGRQPGDAWFTADGRLVAHAGCNTITGQVELSGGQIWMAEMAITEMGCADELLAQDQWLASLLGARPSWQLSGPHLRVSTGQTVIELTDRRVLDPTSRSNAPGGSPAP